MLNSRLRRFDTTGWFMESHKPQKPHFCNNCVLKGDQPNPRFQHRTSLNPCLRRKLGIKEQLRESMLNRIAITYKNGEVSV